MKKNFAFSLFLLCGLSLFAQRSIQDALKEFDKALMDSGSASVDAVIGAITYSDTETCGTVAPWFKEEIQKAAGETRRIRVIPSSQAGEGAQIVAATRSLNAGMFRPKKTDGKKEYVIEGRYQENGKNVELVLTLLDQDKKAVKTAAAFVPMKKIEDSRLTLYPANIKAQKAIDQDYSEALSQTANGRIKISAAMLDAAGNFAELLHPGDSVQFAIQTDGDAYIALQGIDATGDVYWLPIEDNFIPKGKKRIFPDISGAEFRVVDGIFGAESIIVHAFSSKEALESQIKMTEGAYRKGMIGATRGIGVAYSGAKNSASDKNAANGMFKITYTVER